MSPLDVSDRFVNWKRVGSGAHAVVFKTYDKELACDVAVKLLKDEAREDLGLVEGLRQEVLISRHLRHPNICPIHDIYEGPRGIGIVMDFLNGIDLRQWLRDHKGHILESVSERLNLICILARSLQFAHTRIIHRDLKPSNIFLVEGRIDNPVIMDFGISVMGEDLDTGVCGTPKYMAPEQFEAPEKVNQRSDIFALGILAYETLTDRVPPNSLRDVMKTGTPPKIPLEGIPPPSKYCPVLPVSLDRLILQMTAYDIDDRPASAREVADALEAEEVGEHYIVPGSGKRTETAAIPGGTDYLGSSPNGPNSNEKPATRVELSPYRIGLTPVTNEEYRAFVCATGVPPAPLDTDPSFGRSDHPVVCLTWDEAAAFASWVGGRLPTEAEWERAARGSIRFAEFPWGNSPPLPSQANINGIWKTTSPVFAHAAGKNNFGLWDMCGNVWEWCIDAYDANFYSTLEKHTRDPVNSADGDASVIRGGSFESFSNLGRCAFRGNAPKTERRPDIGFRVVYD